MIGLRLSARGRHPVPPYTTRGGDRAAGRSATAERLADGRSVPRTIARALGRAVVALGVAVGVSLVAGIAPRPALAQWVTTHEQFYLQAPHNWEFRKRYVGADRLFNAFDYGHAILYETLLTRPDAPASLLEQGRYDYLTTRVLVNPPRVPLEEAAIEIRYARLAPEAKQMFEWAHILHRQLYDVLADESLSPAAKDAAVARLLVYYRSRSDVAFSSKPKSMKLMQEQPYSLAFRRRYPKFNGLIWAYHWLQVGLYEPLLAGQTSDARQMAVRATVARFWQMLADPPRTLPHQMPMTAVVSPLFTARYPEAAIIFDNLHSMHDVISDILANPAVPRDRKRAEIVLAGRRFRDDTSYVMGSVAAWSTMAAHMGVENMGGPSVGFLAALPAPTVTYGAVMQHDDRTGAMTGFAWGEATGGAHGGHVTGEPAGAGVPPGDGTPAGGAAGADTASVPHAMPGAPLAPDGDRAGRQDELQRRMLADPAIRRRVLADTAMRRLIDTVPVAPAARPPAHGAPVVRRGAAPQDSTPRKPDVRAGHAAPAARRPAAKKPRVKQAAADPHAGHTP